MNAILDYLNTADILCPPDYDRSKRRAVVDAELERYQELERLAERMYAKLSSHRAVDERYIVPLLAHYDLWKAGV